MQTSDSMAIEIMLHPLLPTIQLLKHKIQIRGRNNSAAVLPLILSCDINYIKPFTAATQGNYRLHNKLQLWVWFAA